MLDAEIAIVGAGPAGLVAALYAARFRRNTIVIHDDTSRLKLVSATHNFPAFPASVSGPALLALMAHQVRSHGALIETATIVEAQTSTGGFVLVASDGRRWRSRALILATGVHNHRLHLDAGDHDTAVRQGALRYCPICDGFEHRDQQIAVVGNSAHAVNEAMFLRTFSRDITLLPIYGWQPTDRDLHRLETGGVRLWHAPSLQFHFDGGAIRVASSGQISQRFDTIYAALGTSARTSLAAGLGLGLTADGEAAAETPSGTEIDGLFCAGDAVAGIDQICVATAHGAIAATHAHNWLRECHAECAGTN